MKTREEIREWLLKNAVDTDGDLILSGLDFSDFHGDVYIGGMKVKGDLLQSYQDVKGDLWQGNQVVEGNLRQSYSETEGYYYCKDVKVGGDIFTNEPTKILKKVTEEELAKMGYQYTEEED